MLLGGGVFLVIVVSWAGLYSQGLELGLIALGLVLTVAGLYLNRRYRKTEE